MNYSIHYERLIARARGRVLDGYVERHHVTPKCMGGSNDQDNLVQLTAEEHFVAHQLLHKMYPEVLGLTFALVNMTGNPYGHRSNKLYGWMRKAHVDALSVWMKERWKNPTYVEKQKAGMAELHSDPERMKKIGEAVSKRHKGRVKSPEEIAKFVSSKTGMKYKKMSDESRANMSAARCKTWAERKANGTDKIIAAKIVNTRRKNGTYEFTDEHKANIGKASVGRIPWNKRLQ